MRPSSLRRRSSWRPSRSRWCRRRERTARLFAAPQALDFSNLEIRLPAPAHRARKRQRPSRSSPTHGGRRPVATRRAFALAARTGGALRPCRRRPAAARRSRHEAVIRAPKTLKPRGFHLEASLPPKRSISRTWKYAQIVQELAPTGQTGGRASSPVAKIERADSFRSLMASEGLTRSGLAGRLGVSRAWVTKVLGPRRGHLKVVL